MVLYRQFIVKARARYDRRRYAICIQGRSEAERRQLTLHVIAGSRLDRGEGG